MAWTIAHPQRLLTQQAIELLQQANKMLEVIAPTEVAGRLLADPAIRWERRTAGLALPHRRHKPILHPLRQRTDVFIVGRADRLGLRAQITSVPQADPLHLAFDLIESRGNLLWHTRWFGALFTLLAQRAFLVPRSLCAEPPVCAR